MSILASLFFGSLLLGQLGGISLAPGVVVYIHDLVLIVVTLLLGIRQMRRRQSLPTLFLPISIFVIVAMLSLAVNSAIFSLPVLGISSLYLVRWVLYAGVYLWVVRDLKSVFWLRGLFMTGVGFALLGGIQFFLYPDLRNLTYLGWDPHYYRLFSTLLDPNFMGIIFVLTLLVGFTLWNNTTQRVWIIAGQIIVGVAILLTYSRSSFVALATAVLIGALMTKRWKLLLGLVVLAVAVVITPRTSGSTLSVLRLDTTMARIGNWGDGLQLIMTAPALGHGFNTLRFIQGTQLSPIISKSAAGLDSSILFIGATTGILGLVAYGYLLVSMVRRVMQKHLSRLGIIYVASIGAIIVHSLFVNSLFYPWVLIWVWVLTGVVERDK